jgi:D-alanyl-D-alanine dipeptidase
MALDAVLPDLSGMLTGGAAARPDSITGFQSEFSSAFQSMIANAPERVRNELKITSGYRSPEVQAKLWKEALDKYGSVEKARKFVAPPGKSKHGEGVAVDLHYASDATKQWVDNNAKNYGLAFPLQHEPWHMELASARKRDISGSNTAKRTRVQAAMTRRRRARSQPRHWTPTKTQCGATWRRARGRWAFQTSRATT